MHRKQLYVSPGRSARATKPSGGVRHSGSRTCGVDDDEVMLDKCLLTVTAGVITVSWKVRIFLSGGGFSASTKNTPNATATNSGAVSRQEKKNTTVEYQ